MKCPSRPVHATLEGPGDFLVRNIDSTRNDKVIRPQFSGTLHGPTKQTRVITIPALKREPMGLGCGLSMALSLWRSGTCNAGGKRLLQPRSGGALHSSPSAVTIKCLCWSHSRPPLANTRHPGHDYFSVAAIERTTSIKAPIQQLMTNE